MLRADIDALQVKADETLDEMGQWRKWLHGFTGGGHNVNVPKLAARYQAAVVNAWGVYVEDCRGAHMRPTFQGCLDKHGSDEICENRVTGKKYQLLDLVTDEAQLKAIVHNARAKESARRKADYDEKSKSRQKRKRK